MSHIEPIGFAPGAAWAVLRSPFQPKVLFDRHELNLILSLYGRMVSRGEWRDYAIGFGADTATFAVFRRASERPLYRIVKRPKLRMRQGAFAVVSMTGVVLMRGPALDQVLRVFDKTRLALVK
jgi:hypothetical protein